MQMRMEIIVPRGGEVFKVVSDRGTGGHDLFSCMVEEDRLVRTYMEDGVPVPVRHSLCFIDRSFAFRFRGLWSSLEPSWEFSVWKGVCNRFVEIDRVPGDPSELSDEEMISLWDSVIWEGFDASSFRRHVPFSTVICDEVALISEMKYDVFGG